MKPSTSLGNAGVVERVDGAYYFHIVRVNVGTSRNLFSYL